MKQYNERALSAGQGSVSLSMSLIVLFQGFYVWVLSYTVIDYETISLDPCTI